MPLWNNDPRIAPCSVNPAKSFQAALGNGELGLQGSDSGLAGSRSFMVGVVDLTPSDLHRMALLPTWNAIDLRIPGGASLAEAFAAGRHRNYRQQLDTATATLRTQYTVDLDSTAVRVEVESWLSRADRHLGVVRCRLTADRDCVLEVGIGVRANPTVARHPFRSLVWPHADYPMQLAGLATPCYYGNVLWDVDCHAWLGLLPFAPELSLGTSLFRRRTLDQALRMATRNGCRGALYPWQAGVFAGEDNCPLPVYNRAIHMTFEVSQTMWFQWCALGDRAFLRREAWPVLSAVADFACSRAEWVPWAGRYEFKEVMGVEEVHGLVDNELHTAAIAVRALRLAIRTAEILGLGTDPLWLAVADHLHLPLNPRTGLWQPHSGSDQPSLRRWTESTAYHLAELPATEAQLRDALVPLAAKEGREIEQKVPWNLTFQALVAARLGDADAFALILERQRTVRVDPGVFGLRCEMPGNDAGPYLTGCGSLLQGLLHGGTGLRWDEAGLVARYATCLPAGVERITFTRLRWHGQDHAVTVDRRNGLRVTDGAGARHE
jgi:hypothetical protein